MSQTIFITGTSSGIGKATVEYFLDKDWNVIAGMRNVNQSIFANSYRLYLLPLDVQDINSVKSAVDESIKKFGKIDVIVNNAGYGLLGSFEAATSEELQDQFQTNFFGALNVTKAFLPHFRENRSGMFINTSSMLGQISLPFFSMYSSTKWALEGFFESVQYELEPFNIRCKLVEPGTIKTDFFSRSLKISKQNNLTAYDEAFEKVITNINKRGENGVSPNAVAKVIFKAATDKSNKFRYPVDSTARLLLTLKRFMPFNIYKMIIKNTVK